MRLMFERTGLTFVADHLHPRWTTPKALTTSRREEIDSWLELERRPGQAVLILDDMVSGNTLEHSPLAIDGIVVLCEEGKSFTKGKLQEAQRRLKGQDKP